jgi:hypothetical protein
MPAQDFGRKLFKSSIIIGLKGYVRGCARKGPILLKMLNLGSDPRFETDSKKVL